MKNARPMVVCRRYLRIVKKTLSGALPITKRRPGRHRLDAGRRWQKSISPARIARPAGADCHSSPEAAEAIEGRAPEPFSGRPASSSAIRATLRLSSARPGWRSRNRPSSTSDQSSFRDGAPSRALIGAGRQIVGAHFCQRAADGKRPIGGSHGIAKINTSPIDYLPECRGFPR